MLKIQGGLKFSMMFYNIRENGDKMKAVLQRVAKAQVEINGNEVRKIEQGMLILLGVMQGDTKSDAEILAKKLCSMRIFSDEQDKLNLSLKEIDGAMLIISNFTLGADCRKGNRPSFSSSAPFEKAKKLYEYFIECVRENEVSCVQTGEFGADMQVSLVNDGPITIILNTDELKCSRRS